MTKRLSNAQGLTLALVVVAAHNLIGNLWLSSELYVPANLFTAAILGVIARASGVTAAMLGLDRAHLARGLKWGLGAFGIVLVCIAAAVAVPATRGFFDDARVGDVGWQGMLYQVFIRIPVGTAFFEEFIFRGVLFAFYRRNRSDLSAATWSSMWFGLWHVVPGWTAVTANSTIGDVAGEGGARVAAVAGGVLATWLVGYVFCWLRIRGEHLVSPVLLHTATNSLAFLAAFLVNGALHT